MSGSVITLQHDQQYFTGSAASPLQGKALLRAAQNEIAAILSGAKSCRKNLIFAGRGSSLFGLHTFDDCCCGVIPV